MADVDPSAVFRLDGKVAIVTGASSGLGARMASTLHAAGARVVVAARRVDRLHTLVDQLTGAHPVGCDVARPDDLDRLVGEAVAKFGTIDILVNNAGTTHVGPALDESDEEFDRVIGINLVAPFRLARRVARVMADRGGGSIVNVASILGLRGSARIPQAGYTAAKGGLINLTRELAAQWGRHGIRVNALAPGWFRSELTTEMLDHPRGHDFVARRTVLGRPGADHELDGSILYLAADASSYVTGHVLVVDGGWTAT